MGIHIELDNINRSYFAGQTVDGRVVIQNSNGAQVKEVTVFLEGKGRVHWTEHVPRTGGQRYSNEKSYISLKSILAGDGTTWMTLSEGTISYPFRFELPQNLPSSFNSLSCQVSYVLKAEIRRPDFRSSDRTRLPFTVNGLMDLNKEPKANLPQECNTSKGYSFCGLKKGHISFALKLPKRSGFVPGEVIDFRAEITNNSSRKIYPVKALLQQVTKLYSMGISKEIRKTISEVKGPEIDKAEHEVWSGSLSVPAVPPTRMGGNEDIFDIWYFLHLEMNVSGVREIRTLAGELPVLIGNIPLRSTFGEFCSTSDDTAQAAQAVNDPEVVEPSPSTSKRRSNFTGITRSTSLFLDYPDLPPPSYVEAVGTEGFTWHPDGDVGTGNEVGQPTLVIKKTVENDDVPELPASASSEDDFVPKYITYKRRM